MTLLMFSILACSGGESTSPPAAEVGSYQLLSVNGAAVPTVTVQSGDFTTEILSGTFTVDASGTFTESRNGRVTLGTGTPSLITSTQSGTWEKSAGQVQFTAMVNGSPVATFGGTLSGTNLTLAEQATTFVYMKL